MKQLDLFGGEIEVDQLAKEQNKKLIKQANELLKIVDEQIEEHEELLKQQEEEK